MVIAESDDQGGPVSVVGVGQSPSEGLRKGVVVNLDKTIAAIQAEQGDNGSARNTLEDIIARFPTSEAAGKARTRLAALRR